MNFLAHIYLSGSNEDLRFGNFIADFIRGNKLNQFSVGVQKGIQLHRAIDTFTDQHPIFRKHCKLLYPEHGHYARVIMDVVYDHFLAAQWKRYHTDTLENFADAFYLATADRIYDLPVKMQGMFATMHKQNWLLQYATVKGLENILMHMSKRTSFPAHFDRAIPTIQQEKAQMLPQFYDFFEELCLFSKNHSNLDS